MVSVRTEAHTPLQGHLCVVERQGQSESANAAVSNLVADFLPLRNFLEIAVLPPPSGECPTARVCRHTPVVLS